MNVSEISQCDVIGVFSDKSADLSAYLEAISNGEDAYWVE